MSSAKATLLGGTERFSCMEANSAVLAAIRARGQPTLSLVQTQPEHPWRRIALRTFAFIPYYLTIQTSPTELL